MFSLFSIIDSIFNLFSTSAINFHLDDYSDYRLDGDDDDCLRTLSGGGPGAH